MNDKSSPSSSEPILLTLRWGEAGLDVVDTPDRMDHYEIPASLQRSLGASGVTDGPRHIRGSTIPFGVVANLLIRTGWCRLTLNFEPGPDRKLRFYMSAAAPRLSDTSEPVQVVLFREEEFLSRDLFNQRGTYQSPPLPPGDYLFRLIQGEVELNTVRLSLR